MGLRIRAPPTPVRSLTQGSPPRNLESPRILALGCKDLRGQDPDRGPLGRLQITTCPAGTRAWKVLLPLAAACGLSQRPAGRGSALP